MNNTSNPQKHTKGFAFSDATFLYECIDETRNQRLMALFNGLKQLGWIDQKTSQQQFIDLFSGEPLYHRVKWTGSKQHLAFLFKMLVSKKMYVRTTHARIWITVRSHFVMANSQVFDPDMNAQQKPGERPSQIIALLAELLNPSSALPSAFKK